MSLFNSILQKLQKNIDAQHVYKKTVIEVVREVVGVTIGSDSIISLKEGTLRIRVDSTVKVALLMKKEMLIQKMKAQNVLISTITLG